MRRLFHLVPLSLYLLPKAKAMRLLIILVLGLTCAQSVAQSTSDCAGAIVLCGDVYAETEASFTAGEIEYTGDCNSSFQETSSIWYTFTVYEDGLLSFILNPLDPVDDYDWGLFDITNGGCEGIGAVDGAVSPEVGCNSWGTAFGENGATGISTENGGTGASNGPGDLNGPPFNADLPVQAGSSYALVVMNWSNSVNGYTIDFGQSTAVLYDQEPPTLQSLETDCVLQEFVVTFSEPLVVETVEPTDFVLSDPAGNATAISAVVANEPGPTSASFTLTLPSPLAVSGDYVLEITENSLLVEDPCGNAGSGTLTQYFEVVQQPNGWPMAERVICQGESLTLTTELEVSQPAANLVDYVWMLDDGSGMAPDTLSTNAELIVQGPGLFLVNMTTNPPCFEAEGSFLVQEEVCNVIIPNVITPYGTSGANDRFFISGLQVFENAGIQIFNRWGNVVFEDDEFNRSFGWDPVVMSAASGVYQFILRIPERKVPLIVTDVNGVEQTYEGDGPVVIEGVIHVMD